MALPDIHIEEEDPLFPETTQTEQKDPEINPENQESGNLEIQAPIYTENNISRNIRSNPRIKKSKQKDSLEERLKETSEDGNKRILEKMTMEIFMDQSLQMIEIKKEAKRRGKKITQGEIIREALDRHLPKLLAIFNSEEE